MKTTVSRAHKVVVALLFLFSLSLGLYLSYRDSMTTDEGIHVASAYLVLTRHEFRFDPEHPYLYKVLTALPLLAVHLNMPPRDQELWDGAYRTVDDSWPMAREWADEWYYQSGNNADLMVFLSRIPSVLITLAFCWLAYYLGRLWFSPRVGLFALVFTVFNPTVIAHGHLTGNDVAAALAFLGTVWALWYYGERPGLHRAALLGLVFAAAELTKFSLLTLAPILLVWMVYLAITRKDWKRVGTDFLLVLLVTWILIWLAYLGPLNLINGTIFQLKGGRDLPPFIPVNPVIFHRFLYIRYFLPVDYIKGVLLIVGGSVAGRPTYLLGHLYPTGTHVWAYFPVIYALKTQLAGLALLVLGLVIGIRNAKGWHKKPLTILLLIAAGIYLFFSLENKINIGVRHVLPLMGLASLVMALSLDWLVTRFKKAWVAPGALALYIAPALLTFPNYLGYGNTLIHPSSDSYYYFSDSNIDWGQQAKDIADVMHEQFPGETLHITYRWNPYTLGYYQVPVQKVSEEGAPVGSLVAVTATDLSGTLYQGLRDKTPVATIQNNTFFYRVQPGDFK
ncbi:MAG: glycosyltransferase family 39 protein [bacterium]